jgi:hypothetical protein
MRRNFQSPVPPPQVERRQGACVATLIGWDGQTREQAIQGVTALGRFYEALLGYSCLKSAIVGFFNLRGKEMKMRGWGQWEKRGSAPEIKRGVVLYSG